MANQEHLDILNQGVVMWNQWRKEYPDIYPDLIGADLSDIDLREADLSETYLIKADLSGTDLSDVRFYNDTILGGVRHHLECCVKVNDKQGSREKRLTNLRTEAKRPLYEASPSKSHEEKRPCRSEKENLVARRYTGKLANATSP